MNGACQNIFGLAPSRARAFATCQGANCDSAGAKLDRQQNGQHVPANAKSRYLGCETLAYVTLTLLILFGLGWLGVYAQLTSLLANFFSESVVKLLVTVLAASIAYWVAYRLFDRSDRIPPPSPTHILAERKRISCPCRKSDSTVMVVESTQNGACGDRAELLNRPPEGRILAQREMCPEFIVVACVRFEDSAQVALAEDDHMVQASPPNRPDQPLRVSVLPG